MPPRRSPRLGFLSLVLFAAAVSLAAPQDNAAAHFNRGNALSDKGDLDGAIAEYRKALRLRPNYFDAHYLLGNALYAKGDEGAIAEFREVLRLQPDYPEAHYNLGIALATRGNNDEAAREFTEAQRLNPKLKPPADKPPQ